jgi:hypothetical protein
MSDIIYLRHLPADPARDPCFGCRPGCSEVCEACTDRLEVQPVQHKNITARGGVGKEKSHEIP